MGPTDAERRSIAAEPYRRREREAGRLPDSGPPMENVRLEQDHDYPADQDLVFTRGRHDFRTRMTPDDEEAVLAILGECTDREKVTVYLTGFLAWVRESQPAASGEPSGEPDTEALARVIAMLEG